MDADVRGLLERGVSALERLAEEPVIQMETAPPVCPACDKINPKVRTSESEGEGPMAEIVYRFHCIHCNAVFYAIPLQWASTSDIEQAKQIISERAEVGGYAERAGNGFR